ncbi:hypothetical protein [Leifsonia aquatica]|uniref:hypothetical protein n=1 Tax=Leifsonia aquatica TaxID=144185 RepID=UPI0004697707|nr:hypothetical protein [Leifsonia aquatica]
MGLLEEYVTARVNAAEDARHRAEREVLRQRRERVVVVRWWDALHARRTVRGAGRAAAVAPVAAPSSAPSAAPSSAPSAAPSSAPGPSGAAVETEAARELARTAR